MSLSSKTTIAAILAKASPAARTEFEEIWKFRLETKQWPTNRWIYKRLTKPKFDEILEELNGSYIIETDSSGTKTYELRPFAVLCTARGQHYLDLLRRYIEYVRHVFFNLDTQNNVSRAELVAKGIFSGDEATELGRILCVGNFFYTSPGHALDFSTWEAILPSDLGDILPNEGPTAQAFETLLLRQWQPNTPVSYYERSLRMQMPMTTLDEIFGVAGSTPQKKSVKRSRVIVSVGTQTKVLTQSRRRCAYCFGLNGILEEKDGQIAHIDRNPKNAKPENLVWLCLEHHNAYDSAMSQSKGYTPGELKHYRAELGRALKRNEHRSMPRAATATTISAPATLRSPYDQLIAKSPRDAVATAWKDLEQAAYGVLETKMAFPDRSAPIPISAFVALLRNFAGVDQEHAAGFGQLGGIREAIAAGGPIDESIAVAYCARAVILIAYLRTK